VCPVVDLKGDTDASILVGVKIVQKKVNNGVSKIRPRIKTNIFPRNNSESFTWSAKSQQKVSIADGQTFSDSINEKVREI
jgi:hypothetical protein